MLRDLLVIDLSEPSVVVAGFELLPLVERAPEQATVVALVVEVLHVLEHRLARLELFLPGIVLFRALLEFEILIPLGVQLLDHVVDVRVHVEILWLNRLLVQRLDLDVQLGNQRVELLLELVFLHVLG